jgi:hypothetical protein
VLQDEPTIHNASPAKVTGQLDHRWLVTRALRKYALYLVQGKAVVVVSYQREPQILKPRHHGFILKRKPGGIRCAAEGLDAAVSWDFSLGPWTKTFHPFESGYLFRRRTRCRQRKAV